MLTQTDQANWTTILSEMAQSNLHPEQMQRELMRRDQVVAVNFWSHFKAQNDKLMKRQQSLWKEDYKLWTRTTLYYNGGQILVPRGDFGYTIKRLKGPNHSVFVFNKLRPASDQITAAWVQSHPEVMLAVFDGDSRKARRAVYEMQGLNEHLNYLHFGEKARQDVAKGGQFCGNYHAEIFWDEESDGTEWYQRFDDIEFPDEDWYECLNCGSAGVLPPDQVQQYGANFCPECSSTYVTVEQMEGFSHQEPVEEGWARSGEVGLKLVPAYCMRYSRTTGADLSPWRYVFEDEPRELVEAKWGKLPASATGDEWAKDEMMIPERILRRAGRESDSGWDEDDLEATLVQRFFYEPEMLAFVKCDSPVQLPNGEQIPPGVRLSEVFPKGMRITTVPGLKTFLDVARESHRKRFVDGVYGVSYGQVTGYGIEDSVVSQKHYNLFRSGIARHFQKTFLPSVVIDPRFFPDKKLFNREDQVIPANRGDLPDNMSVRDAFALVQGGGVNPQIAELLQQYEVDIKETVKAYDSQGDYIGAEQETATASRIGLGRSEMNINLHLALYAGWMKEVAVRRLEVARENYGEERMVTAPDPRGGRMARVLKSLNLRQAIMAWVKPGSFSPNLDIQKQEATMARLSAQGALAKLGMDTPQNRRILDEVFQSELGRDATGSRVDACDDALDEMLEYFAAMGGQVMPEELYALSPVDPYEKDLDIRVDWWRTWLSSPEGRDADPIIRQAVKIHIEANWKALGFQQMSMTGMGAISPGGMIAGMPAPAGAGGPDAPLTTQPDLMGQSQPPGMAA